MPTIAGARLSPRTPPARVEIPATGGYVGAMRRVFLFTIPVLITILVLAAFASLSASAQSPESQSPKSLGSFKDWDAFSYHERGGKVCFIVSAPLDKEPKGVCRGDVYVLVTHRPAHKVTDEVSIVAGYPYKAGGEAEVTIGGTTFPLFTDGESAWTREAKEDKALVRAMIRGTTMIVRGTSRRGTLTTDSYSLTGFTAAHEAIAVACKVK